MNYESVFISITCEDISINFVLLEINYSIQFHLSKDKYSNQDLMKQMDKKHKSLEEKINQNLLKYY